MHHVSTMPVGATTCHSDVSDRHCGQNRVAGNRYEPQFPQRSTLTSPRPGRAPARRADPDRRRLAAVSRWIPTIDDRRYDRCRRHVMGERAVLHLALPALPPNLQHRLEIERPALHIGLGQMATRCICRISRAKRQMAFRCERPALALAAITEALKREEHARREIVVDQNSPY